MQNQSIGMHLSLMQVQYPPKTPLTKSPNELRIRYCANIALIAHALQDMGDEIVYLNGKIHEMVVDVFFKNKLISCLNTTGNEEYDAIIYQKLEAKCPVLASKCRLVGQYPHKNKNTLTANEMRHIFKGSVLKMQLALDSIENKTLMHNDKEHYICQKILVSPAHVERCLCLTGEVKMDEQICQLVAGFGNLKFQEGFGITNIKYKEKAKLPLSKLYLMSAEKDAELGTFYTYQTLSVNGQEVYPLKKLHNTNLYGFNYTNDIVFNDALEKAFTHTHNFLLREKCCPLTRALRPHLTMDFFYESHMDSLTDKMKHLLSKKIDIDNTPHNIATYFILSQGYMQIYVRETANPAVNAKIFSAFSKEASTYAISHQSPSHISPHLLHPSYQYE